MSLIQVSNLSYAYAGGADALASLSLDIAPGEVVGLLGRNGAGKTTLLHCLLGLLRPEQGTVSVFGLDPRRDALEVKRRLGHVSEHDMLPPGRRVEELLQFHADLFPDWDSEVCDDLVGRLGFTRRARIRELSKGQVRQVSLVCAVSHRPELLLLDEPAGGLDPAARREVLQAAIELLVEGGTTVLFSSHHMQDVERLAQRIVLLHDGRVLLDDQLDSLREGCALAVLPADQAAQLETLPSCLRVRPRGDVVHASVAAAPEQAQTLLSEHLSVARDDVRCTPLNLEDLFVELVG
jgi:ABC-2 type transport system ATP-binding protein